MDDDKIKNQITEVVSASPAKTQQEAQQPIDAPSYSTLRTGLPDEMKEAPVAQYETTPDRGIEFTKDTDEMITGGTAIPGLGYDTRFKTVDDMGDPLYFEPNFQPVVPYPVGNIETDTVNPNKAEWQLAMNYGGNDADYIGYYLLPEQGSQSWWDFFAGQINSSISMTIPKLLQGAVGLATSAAKMPFVAADAYQKGDYKIWGADPKLQQVLAGAGLRNKQWAPMIDKIRTLAPESDSGSLFNAIMKEAPGDAVRILNTIQDVVDGAVEPLEKEAFLTWDADTEDTSFKAQSARGVASGAHSFMLAVAAGKPDIIFTLLNYAQVGEMRRNALNYGVSPSWAEAYSIGGAGLNVLLDLFEFGTYMNSASLIKQGSKQVLQNLQKKGLVNAITKHAKREGIATAAEVVTEMTQESIEGAYSPSFREDPFTPLAVAGLSAFALKAMTLPVSVRHANAEERYQVAEALGVKSLLDAIYVDGHKYVDSLAEQGIIDPSQKEAVFNDLLSNAPDVIIKTIREGVKGQLDKIPAAERKEFLKVLNDINKNFGNKVFSPKTMAKLDTEVDNALSDVRAGISDAEAEMIKGLVRGAYVNAAIANRNNPDYEGFQVPTFVVTKNKNGYSYYDSNKNEIGIHESRSNTEYTNNSPQYAGRLQDSFVPSSRQSDKMASLIHEMSHWMDHVVGEKGFGDFLEHYYNSIAAAFGNDTARRLYNEREGKNKERPSEYFAQTMGRMGKRSAEAFGLGKSQANKFLSYANIAMNQLANLEGRNGEKLSQSIADFQTALQQVTKANMDKLSDLIEVYGKDNIKRALANFDKDSEGYGDFAEYLANKDMLQELFDVMDSFSDAAGIDKINELFDGDQKAMDNFVTMGDKMFREGYDKAVEEVRQRRAEAKKTAPKPVEAKTGLDLVRTAIGIVDTTTDSSQVHEEGAQYESGMARDRFWSEGKTPLDAKEKISEQTDDVQDAALKIAKKYFVDADGFIQPDKILETYGINDVADVKDLTGDEFVNALNQINGLDLGKTKKILGSYGLNYWGDYLAPSTYELEEGGVQYETQDWAKAALAKDSVKQSFEAGKQEKKQIAADTKIDGRDLTDDINMANQGLTQRLKQPMNKLVKWASSSSWGWGLDRILVTILGRDAAEKLDIAGKYSAKQNIRSRYWDEFMARLKPLFGDPKTNTEFMFKYKTMVTNLGFARMTGVEMIDPDNPAITSTRDITGWEALYVYLMKEQGFGDRIQRSTTTNIDDIIATLSEDEKAFALHMSDQLMSMYEKAFGKSKYAHYFPILDAEHELFDELSIDSLMARQNTDDAIAITDAGRIFSQYVSRWASHESNYFQTMKRTRDIFRYTGVDKNEMGPMYTFDLEQDNARKRASAQVAAEVRQVIGEDGYRNLMNLIESELQDGQEQMFDASRNKTLTQIGNNIIKSILANKMMSFPKNIANVFMFWGGAKDQSRYWNSFAEGLGNFKDTFDYMMKHSPEIKQRWGTAGGINEYLDQRTLGGSTAPIMKGVSKAFAKMDWTGDKTQNMAKFSAVMDMLGDAGLKLFMQSGDMIANVYGGYGLVKDFMAQGMSEADAFKKLDRYIIEHQSSSNLAMKPLVQKLQNKSLMGQVFAFTSEGVAKWASILGTFDEVKMGTTTKSEALANVVSIAISMTLYSLLAAGAWDLLDDDEKVQEETMKALGNTLLDQVFGGLVAGNAFITPAISYLVGDSRVSGMSVPIYNFALDGISALKKGEYDRVITKAMSALGIPVGADNLWNTYLGMSLLNDPNPDVRYAGRLMLAGFTPSRSAKRAGIKKENLEKNDEE